jgi:SAM-dependent methyltransferase
MWWFAALHANLLMLHGRARSCPGRLLDAGCGTGGLLTALAERLSQANILGVELDPIAGAVAERVSQRPVCIGSVNTLPFADGSFAAILSADVLCHRGVDESATLKGFHRCLGKGGLLVLNLPAYRWLLSEHDTAVHNVRRYTGGAVARLLRAAGFADIRISYWNTLLFPVMVLKRKLGRRHVGTAVSDVALLPAPVEALFTALVKAEAALIGLGLRLPFGGSVLATAVKP